MKSLCYSPGAIVVWSNEHECV